MVNSFTWKPRSTFSTFETAARRFNHLPGSLWLLHQPLLSDGYGGARRGKSSVNSNTSPCAVLGSFTGTKRALTSSAVFCTTGFPPLSAMYQTPGCPAGTTDGVASFPRVHLAMGIRGTIHSVPASVKLSCPSHNAAIFLLSLQSGFWQMKGKTELQALSSSACAIFSEIKTRKMI